MGNGCLSTSSSPEDKTKSKKSRELDSFLKDFGRVMQEEIKLLLLGIFRLFFPHGNKINKCTYFLLRARRVGEKHDFQTNENHANGRN